MDTREQFQFARSALPEFDTAVLLDGGLLNRIHLAFQPRQLSRCLSIALEGEQGGPEQDNSNARQNGIAGPILVLLASQPCSMARYPLSLGHELWAGIILVLHWRYVSRLDV